jgi:HSP20 family protein
VPPVSRKVPVYWSELSRLQERLARLLEQAMLGGGGELVAGGPPAGWRPLFDLVETADAFVLFAELPGVRRDDLELDCDGRSIELCGVRRPQVAGEGEFLRLESSHGRFKRRLELPEPVDEAAIEARFRRGMLEVVLPKKPATPVAPVAVPVREE